MRDTPHCHHGPVTPHFLITSHCHHGPVTPHYLRIAAVRLGQSRGGHEARALRHPPLHERWIVRQLGRGQDWLTQLVKHCAAGESRGGEEWHNAGRVDRRRDVEEADAPLEEASQTAAAVNGFADPRLDEARIQAVDIELLRPRQHEHLVQRDRVHVRRVKAVGLGAVDVVDRGLDEGALGAGEAHDEDASGGGQSLGHMQQDDEAGEGGDGHVDLDALGGRDPLSVGHDADGHEQDVDALGGQGTRDDSSGGHEAEVGLDEGDALDTLVQKRAADDGHRGAILRSLQGDGPSQTVRAAHDDDALAREARARRALDLDSLVCDA